jgi:hypothetical protein
VFEYRAFTTVGYSWDAFRSAYSGSTIRACRDAGEILTPGGTPLTAPYPSYSLFSLNTSYQVTEDIGLRFGIDNLFNKAPPIGFQNPSVTPATVAANGQLRGGAFLTGVHDHQRAPLLPRRQLALLSDSRSLKELGLSLAEGPFFLPGIRRHASVRLDWTSPQRLPNPQCERGKSLCPERSVSTRSAAPKCCRSRISRLASPAQARCASRSRRSASTGPRRCTERAAIRPSRSCPSLIGYEGVGTIEALGASVDGFTVGQRVCVLPMIQQGQYGIWAEQAIVPARILLARPRPD